jgi:protein-S-isoprenylcysteine O-methyltransferase Ste14
MFCLTQEFDRVNRRTPSPRLRQVALGIILIVVGWISIDYGIRNNLILILPSVVPVVALIDLALVLIAIGLTIRIFAFKEIRYTHRIGHLVTSGIYSRTRNPIYLSFALIILGIALYFDVLPGYAWVLLGWLSFYWIAKKEESDLEHAFGEDYTRYRNRVPLFLGRSHQSDERMD